MKRAALDRFRAVCDVRRFHALNSNAGLTESSLAPGYFRKGRRVSGCNSARCWLCHTGKLAGFPNIQELRSNDSYREQMSEDTG